MEMHTIYKVNDTAWMWNKKNHYSDISNKVYNIT